MSRSYKWLPVFNEDICTGCGVCIEACSPGCLDIRDRVAVLSRPHFCSSEGQCSMLCPEVCIRMAWVSLQGNQSTGKWKFLIDQKQIYRI
ncbi:MAG: 4Fe-4S binding protein [Deferribacteres bacterium]|nr:4Fe-4S binding protein [candidate division KSB1 bacterium]MCB9503210.1 4Fe-4S binding protein [Deferribacteres bacterium]